MPSQMERRKLQEEKKAAEAALTEASPEVNPFEPTVKLCQKKLHKYDRAKYKQCPECQALAGNASKVRSNMPPDKLYAQLWRVLCRDAASFEEQVTKGKHLNHMQSKQLLEYLKFLQDVKALDELERIEKKHGKDRARASTRNEVVGDEDQTSDDGGGDPERD